VDVDPLEAPAADGQQPVVEYRAARPYLGVVRTVTWTGTAAAADRIPELFAHLTAHGVPPAGAPFLRYHRIAGEHELVVEAGVPVTEPVPRAGEMRVGTLPAGRYLVVVHAGHPDELVAVADGMAAHARDRGWAFDRRGEAWGCRLETFLTDPRVEPDPRRWRTEVAVRLAD
jgi:Transcriptional regulator, effector-binding domain/component